MPALSSFGLRPAVVEGTNQIAPLTAMRNFDTRGWLTGVTTFNFHQHLPHYALTEDSGSARVLARQPIDMSKPHPFTEAGTESSTVSCGCPPRAGRAPEIFCLPI